MMNLKKLAAGIVIALVVGVSAIAGNMNAGIASADGPVVDVQARSQPVSVGYQEISMKKGVIHQIYFD